MSAKVLDGKVLAAKIKEDVRLEVERLKKASGRVPRLVAVVAKDDPSSAAYALSQKKVAEFAGVDYQLLNLPETITQIKFLEEIGRLNADTKVHGIFIHKPLPKQVDYDVVVNAIKPDKDWEGMGEANLGRLLLGKTGIIPCTPAAVIEHLRSTGIAMRGKNAVIVGRSQIVGKPLIFLLLQENATVTVCHSGTSAAGTLPDHVGRADIVVVAIGQPRFLKGEWLKPQATVIDVGINQVDGKMVGDVDFDSVMKTAACVTPVPGGVGPVTVVMLMKNGIASFKQQMNLS